MLDKETINKETCVLLLGFHNPDEDVADIFSRNNSERLITEILLATWPKEIPEPNFCGVFTMPVVPLTFLKVLCLLTFKHHRCCHNTSEWFEAYGKCIRSSQVFLSSFHQCVVMSLFSSHEGNDLTKAEIARNWKQREKNRSAFSATGEMP